MQVNEVLKEVFGFDKLRAGQEEVVSVLLEGRGALRFSQRVAGNRYAISSRRCCWMGRRWWFRRCLR